MASGTMMIYHLTGEPAVVIYGVPSPVAEAEPPGPSDSAAGAAPAKGNPGLGGWMAGREVRKLFLDQYYSGTVMGFDKEAGWYRVEYEDGDSEDLEWPELEQVLVPLDIAIPLKSMALRVLGKNQKSLDMSGTAPQTAKKRGRPKGSKNQVKKVEEGQAPQTAPQTANKIEKAAGEEQAPQTAPQTAKKRGRPKGSKNKVKEIEKAVEEGQAPRVEQLPAQPV